jgi:N-acetylmuramoyl-L-alanine amidase
MKGKRVLLIFLLLTSLVLLFAVWRLGRGPLDGIIVCLDPGHGGSDRGATNALFGLDESEINLDIAFGLKFLLEQEGARVVMTRSDDTFLTNYDRYTFCSEQRATILISVHTNSFDQPQPDGSLVLYGPGEAPALAQAIQEAMYPLLSERVPPGVAAFTDYGIDVFASGVLFKSGMPSAMVEPLFMSNLAEAEQLAAPIFVASHFHENCREFSCRRGQVARAVLQGTLAYFEAQSENRMAQIMDEGGD